ncbi:hypothetical protein D6833_01645 [Candidatus Parcubacteria bacterium]|nr:MAG: hypothetical protein D6833_01645 [Candidatus Parcubacteria bacterium]
MRNLCSDQTQTRGGYILRRFAGIVQSIASPATEREIAVGDIVVLLNAHLSVPRGAKGVVLKIQEPYRNGRTSDVISVHFFGYPPPPLEMKPEEIMPLLPE